ncbi:MAG: N-acetyl-alpha-D-glucosaminyl L-malate synthase BshA [Bryobacterales bacterium]|nr:N-acetyl-alpha-D-glucosaminyl L-malate synthase BshA [Bryobacterales bacterium]
MERPLTIAVICHPTLGGSGVVATDLGLALARRGHSIHVVSHRRPVRISATHPRFRFHEVPVTRYPLFTYPPYTLALATKLATLCRTKPIDVLHAHYAIPHAVSALLCRQMLGDSAPKIVTTLHGTDITLLGLDDSFYEITRFSLLQSDGLTAVSTFLARETEELFRLNSEVRTIHNFIDLERFSPARREPAIRSRYVCGDEALVGHLSNFRWVKRTTDVVRIFHRIVQHRPACLLMIGDGPDMEAVKLVAEELGVSSRVAFLGAEQDAAELLPQLDLFLLPSEQESFGLAALESMACGVPVIASTTGGLPELVTEGESGYLFPVGDVTAMGRKAAEILGDASMHRRLRTGARARASEFSEAGLVERYEALYREVVAR